MNCWKEIIIKKYYHSKADDRRRKITILRLNQEEVVIEGQENLKIYNKFLQNAPQKTGYKGQRKLNCWKEIIIKKY